jgi:hypothetical protein
MHVTYKYNDYTTRLLDVERILRVVDPVLGACGSFAFPDALWAKGKTRCQRRQRYKCI